MKLCEGYNYFWLRADVRSLRAPLRVRRGALRLRPVNGVVPVILRPAGAVRGSAVLRLPRRLG